MILFSVPMLLRDAEMAVAAGLCASRFEVFRKDIRHEIRHAWQYELLDIEGIDEFDFQYINSPLEQDAYAIQLYGIAQSAEEFIASVKCAI